MITHRTIACLVHLNSAQIFFISKLQVVFLLREYKDNRKEVYLIDVQGICIEFHDAIMQLSYNAFVKAKRPTAYASNFDVITLSTWKVRRLP